MGTPLPPTLPGAPRPAEHSVLLSWSLYRSKQTTWEALLLTHVGSSLKAISPSLNIVQTQQIIGKAVFIYLKFLVEYVILIFVFYLNSID